MKSPPLAIDADINPIRFSSKVFHTAAGIYDYGFRFYDPGLQRWLNRDPLGEVGFEKLGSVRGIRDDEVYGSDGPNLYAFVGNNPLNHIDPWGLVSLPPGFGGPGRPYDPTMNPFNGPLLPPGFGECLANCLDKFDPLPCPAAKLGLLGLGPWPKPFVTPGSTPYTNVPRNFFGLKDLGRSWLVKFVTIPTAVVYGSYLAGVEISCAVQCGADPNAF
jgi:RHS repeat-associated protein